MRIGLYHGYELSGSGSNEYNRYLSRAFARRGHEVHVLCRESDPESISHVTEAFRWSDDGRSRQLFERSTDEAGSCTVHCLPDASVKPVYLADKQRSGNVKTFGELSDAELDEYHSLCVAVVTAVLRSHPVDVLQANHCVYQPIAAAEACARTGTPWVAFPHGSSIEYVLRPFPRYRPLVERALQAANGVISGNDEVLDRLKRLFPALADVLAETSEIVGVGVDTALFQPLARERRAASVAELVRMVEGSGETPTGSSRPRARLDAGRRGADEPEHAPSGVGEPDADLADKLGRIAWNDPTLLFVGALTSGKGLQSLLAAFPEVLRRQPKAQLLIVGSGVYRETLEALVHALAHRDESLFDHLVAHGFDLDRNELEGPWPDVAYHASDPDRRRALFEAGPRLEQQVYFLGRLDHSQLRHLFPCADLAVFPSVVPEAYPLVLMESLANGVLPVVTDFSGFADGLRQLEPLLGTAWVDRMKIPLDPTTRVEGIARSLAALLEDPELSELIPRLRAIAVEHFDWDIRARQMENAYERLTARERGPCA